MKQTKRDALATAYEFESFQRDEKSAAEYFKANRPEFSHEDLMLLLDAVSQYCDNYRDDEEGPLRAVAIRERLEVYAVSALT